MKKKVFENILFIALFGFLLGILLFVLEENGIIANFTMPVWIIIFIVVYIVIFLYLILRSYFRQKYLISILNDQVDPDLFLKEIQVDIDKTANQKQKNLLLVNKSAALFLKGQFYDVLTLLKSINPNDFNKNFKAAYYNNLILALLETNQQDEVAEILKECSEVFSPNTKYESLNIAIRSTNATADFYQGKLLESKSEFDELLKEDLHSSARASILFYLGQIDLKQENINLGTGRLKEAAELGKKTYISAKVKELITNI